MKDLKLQNCRLNDRYEILKLLGRGSYAEIYIAKDVLAAAESAHEYVVIKALNVFMQNDLDLDLEQTLVENFQNEAIALDRVRHPNIISRLGHGTARDLDGTVFHYLVLEYMPGGDLAKLCKNESLSVSDCLNFLEQVCAGIAHAHEKEIIHRDIKPQNLLLTENKKVVKIGDFGVARFSQMTSPITRVGTNIYSPPEHSPALAGDTQSLAFAKLTPAADVYSIAKSAYVLFTGASPRFFAGQPVTELPHAFRREVWAENLVKVLNRATQKDPRNRFQNVNEFWEELSKLRLLDDEATTQTVISPRNNLAPQPQIAAGYSPNAPLKPKFDTSRELKLKPHVTVGQHPPLVVEVNKNDPLLKPKRVPPQPIEDDRPTASPDPPVKTQKRSFMRIAGVFMILLALFAGSLYATYSYLSRNGLSIFGVSKKMGTATTDINLRSAPTTGNTPIGLVTKNSRIEVVNIENNWYQIVIIEHGRPKSDPGFADSGWAYGRYIDLDE